MGKPLSPDHVFDFPMNEPHPAYDFFAPAPLPEYADNLNNNNGWLAADDYLLGELAAMVNEQMVVPAVEEVVEPVVEEEEEQMEASDGVCVWRMVWEVNEDWLMAPTTPPPVLAVPPPSVYEVGGPSTAVDEGPSFPQVALRLPMPPSVIEDLSTRLDNLEYRHRQFVQRVVQGSDAEITVGVTIREIGPRVLAVEGQMQVESGQQTSTQRDETVTGLTQQVQALQADVQQRDTQIPAATYYCYRDEQQGEHADAVHLGIGETDCSLREKTTKTQLRWLVTRLKVRNGEDFSYCRRMLPLTYQPMAVKKTSFPEIECGGSIDISIPDVVKDQGEALNDA
ncbi:hypothetical protein Tco_1081503 [Tanacetum coccineum]|uniref:Uncharacterized protein n=1 Tax=Tanacetum coccineum TaxID=301880 RepID=A0ABQ5HXW3_9ASTR